MKKIKKIVAVVLSMCFVLGMLCSVAACDGEKPVGGGGNVINPGDNIAQIIDNEGNILDGANVYNLPSAMTFVSPMGAAVADPSGVTVTATVLPESAENKQLSWSVAWVSTADTGAVTDYVTVTPAAQGSNIATVKCLKAFGQKIKIVVTSVSSPSVKAECTLDYLQRLNASATMFIYDVDGNETQVTPGAAVLNLPSFDLSGVYSSSNAFSAFLNNFQNTSLTIIPAYTKGTICDVVGINAKLEATTKGASMLSYLFSYDYVHGDISAFTFPPVERNFSNQSAFGDMLTEMVQAHNGIDSDCFEAFLNNLIHDGAADFRLTLTVVHGNYADETFSFNFRFNTSLSTYYNVSQIILDTGNLVFG